MAVTGVLTKRNGALVEIQHVLRSNENGQENKEHLHCLSNCLKKLQSDVNSCLTEIIKQDTLTVCSSASDNSKEISDEEDSDESDGDPEDIKSTTKTNGGPHEPQAKKLRT